MHVSAEHLLGAARERFALQDYYGAIHLLEELIEAGGAYADAHHLLGLSYSLLGQSERALAAFDAALGLNPRYLEALIHRGLVLSELGRAAEAEAAFGQARAAEGPAVAGFPGHVAARLANQHAALGEAYAEAFALAEAVAQYRRALELGPEFHDLRYRLARLLLEAGQPLAAREELERVLVARPNFVDAEAALGLAHYLAGDALAARDVWRGCLARRPENARVEAYLAMVERAAG
ncbi:MAG TPA: tetratricopeptide repeat protein [Gemmatimonadales bacterium]|nr:tetratricopeptide repeat protein [Gemmatimonadales bacterium]